MTLRLVVCAIALSLLPLSAMQARADRFVALVVGNSQYEKADPLPNAQRDAAAVADRLRDLGFEVTEVFDGDAFTLNRAAERFVAQAKGADLALFYFAGHGIQLFDQNFPARAQCRSQPDFARRRSRSRPQPVHDHAALVGGGPPGAADRCLPEQSVSVRGDGAAGRSCPQGESGRQQARGRAGRQSRARARDHQRAGPSGAGRGDAVLLRGAARPGLVRWHRAEFVFRRSA